MTWFLLRHLSFNICHIREGESPVKWKSTAWVVIISCPGSQRQPSSNNYICTVFFHLRPPDDQIHPHLTCFPWLIICKQIKLTSSTLPAKQLIWFKSLFQPSSTWDNFFFIKNDDLLWISFENSILFFTILKIIW